jgi:hypothetical protein
MQRACDSTCRSPRRIAHLLLRRLLPDVRIARAIVECEPGCSRRARAVVVAHTRRQILSTRGAHSGGNRGTWKR